MSAIFSVAGKLLGVIRVILESCGMAVEGMKKAAYSSA